MDLQAHKASAFDQRVDIFRGRSVYHAAPLHYLPSIFARGELAAGAVVKESGISPRKSAVRRDKSLGVDKYVHLSFDLVTPLLRDKLSRGMPHVVLAFDAGDIVSGESIESALLPFNTKAWRSRSDLHPIVECDEMAAILRRRDDFGRFSSLELLVAPRVSLVALTAVTVFSERDEVLVCSLASGFAPSIRHLIRRDCVSQYEIVSVARTQEYIEACLRAGEALPPPQIDFD